MCGVLGLSLQAAKVSHGKHSVWEKELGFRRAGFLFFVFLSGPLLYLGLGFPHQHMKGLGQKFISKDASNTKPL